MNVAYTEKFRVLRRKLDYLFAPGYRSSEDDNTIKFEDGFSIRTKIYKNCATQSMIVSENELLDCHGHILYAWRNLDTDGEFCSLFRHQNGRHYLVFRIELYGYSVYEVESGKELHYIPSQVYPEEGQEFREVFIWTSADYSYESNLLAVTGCIWACPFSTIVLDFSRPLEEQPVEQWLDIQKIIDPKYDLYEDIEFICWENGALLLRAYNENTNLWENIRLSEQQLRAAAQ